jgi:hypothetical protein
MQSAEKPHQLDVSQSLPFELPRGTHAVHVSVNVQLEQIAGMEARAPSLGRLCTREPKLVQLQLIHIGVNESDRMIGGNVIVEYLREEGMLITPYTFDEAHSLFYDGMRVLTQSDAAPDAAPLVAASRALYFSVCGSAPVSLGPLGD